MAVGSAFSLLSHSVNRNGQDDSIWRVVSRSCIFGILNRNCLPGHPTRCLVTITYWKTTRNHQFGGTGNNRNDLSSDLAILHFLGNCAASKAFSVWSLADAQRRPFGVLLWVDAVGVPEMERFWEGSKVGKELSKELKAFFNNYQLLPHPQKKSKSLLKKSKETIGWAFIPEKVPFWPIACRQDVGIFMGTNFKAGSSVGSQSRLSQGWPTQAIDNHKQTLFWVSTELAHSWWLRAAFALDS